jgi:hypothetical protein
MKKTYAIGQDKDGNSVELRRVDSSGSGMLRGSITLDLRDDCIYYTWRVDGADGRLLGSVSQPVSLRLVPPGSDPFDFAVQHAIEGITRHRQLRRRVFEVARWGWLE